mmetsp:Transcript_33305/g.106265  ORF Transcript_33305/g.106265 Transcript_33305/m.106265 type:complete len:226 (-) Transcript_33305:18-695(-)
MASAPAVAAASGGGIARSAQSATSASEDLRASGTVRESDAAARTPWRGGGEEAGLRGLGLQLSCANSLPLRGRGQGRTASRTPGLVDVISATVHPPHCQTKAHHLLSLFGAARGAAHQGPRLPSRAGCIAAAARVRPCSGTPLSFLPGRRRGSRSPWPHAHGFPCPAPTGCLPTAPPPARCALEAPSLQGWSLLRPPSPVPPSHAAWQGRGRPTWGKERGASAPR